MRDWYDQPMRVQQPVTIMLIIAAIVWLATRVIWPRLRGLARYRGLTVARHWNDDGRQTQVAGQPYYGSAIAAAQRAGGRACTACLVPEDNNEYDSNAVAVVIEKRLVGYLAPQDAVGLRGRLKAAGIAGAVTSCPAHISGGGEQGSYSITLALAAGEVKPPSTLSP
ncbi:MAG: hypothetical protein FWG56_00650 [Desulfovibrionaceae bacterium]|nr:hypothetical protein [Desulfovibrionaceae bacterium]